MTIEKSDVYLIPGEDPYDAIVEAGLGIIHAFVDSAEPFSPEPVSNQYQKWSRANMANGVTASISLHTTNEIMRHVETAVIAKPSSLHELATPASLKFSSGSSAVVLRTAAKQSSDTSIPIIDIHSVQVEGVEVSSRDKNDFEERGIALLEQLLSTYQAV